MSSLLDDARLYTMVTTNNEMKELFFNLMESNYATFVRKASESLRGLTGTELIIALNKYLNR